MHNLKLIVFDWDGTIVDSTGRIVDSMQKAAAEHEMPLVTNEAVRNIIGLGLPEAIKSLWPSIDAMQLQAMIASYAHQFVHASEAQMKLYDGAEELLNYLLKENYLLAVATGKARKGLDRMFRDFDLGHYFKASRCADETKSKPNPLMLNELLAELGVDASETLMIGDTTYDLEMASRAGVASVGLTYGAHDEKRLLACNPLAICHSMHELKDWIENNGK